MVILGSRVALPFLLLAIGGLIVGSGCGSDQKTATSEPPRAAPPPPSVEPAPSGTLAVGFDVGNLAPEIEGEDLDGQVFRLSDYRGKVVVLDFWGDW